MNIFHLFKSGAPAPSAEPALPPAIAKWTPSPNFATRMGVTIDTIILHNTAGPLEPSVARFLDHESEVSAHYMVDRDGTVYQFVKDDMTAWHAGNRSMNQRSIGIEIVAHAAALRMEPPQEQALLGLMRLLMKGHSIQPDRIFPHRHVVATLCPSFVWPTDVEFAAWAVKNFGTKGTA